MKLVIAIPLSIVFFNSLEVSIQCANRKRRIDSRIKSQPLTVWGDEDRKKILKIFYETKTGEKDHGKRLKEKWDQLHVMERNHSTRNLYTRATSWIKRGEADRLLTEEERQCKEYKPHKKMKWTPKMKFDVLRFYDETDPTRRNQSRRMKELWDREYPNYPEVTTRHLMNQVWNLMAVRRKVTNTKTTHLTRNEKKDLLRCYYMASKNNDEELKDMRDLFIKRYPQYANISLRLLYDHLSDFREKHPKLDAKFSKEVPALNTLHRLSMEASQSRREESTSIGTFGSDNHLHRVSNSYSDQEHDDAWIAEMIEELSSPSLHISLDIDKSHQSIHSGHPGHH